MTTNVWIALVVGTSLVLAPGSASTSDRRLPAAARGVGGPPDTLLVNSRGSSIHWKGGGLGGRAEREGTIRIASGMFVTRHERLTSGVFTIDMRQLDASLRSEALFDAARHPAAVFTATGMTRVGPARWRVSGDLELRGVSRPVTFDTDVRWEEMGHMVATANFTIDRREWGIGSRGSAIANEVVDPGIQLSVTVDAHRKQSGVASR